MNLSFLLDFEKEPVEKIIVEGSVEYYAILEEWHKAESAGFDSSLEEYFDYLNSRTNKNFFYILKRSPKKTFTKKQKVLSLNKEVSQTAKDSTKRTFKMFAGNKNTYISLNTSSIIVEGKNGTKNFFKILENGNVEVTCSAIVPTGEGKIEIELES